MSHPHLTRHGVHLGKRVPSRRPDPVPPERLSFLSMSDRPSPVKRSPAETTSMAYQSCGPNDSSSACEKQGSSVSTTTLPVVLGAVLPIICAIIVLFFLHRRHIKKLRSEDANDKHKSLDFGMDMVAPDMGGRKGTADNAGAEMTQTEKSERKGGKGMSMDMIGSPYLLPPGLQGSRESLRSLSRSITGDDDKYRPATSFISNDNASLRSYSHFNKWGQDDVSSFTGSASRLAPDDMHQNLLQNAQRMSTSSPPLRRDSLTESIHVPGNPEAEKTSEQNSLPSAPGPVALAPPKTTDHGQSKLTMSGLSTEGLDLNRGNDYLSNAIYSQDFSDHPGHARSTTFDHGTDEVLPGQAVTSRDSIESLSSPIHSLPSLVGPSPTPMITASAEAPSISVHQAPRISLPFSDVESDYGDTHQVDSVIPAVNILAAEEDKQQDNPAHPAKAPPEPSDDVGYSYDTRRLTVGIRPLPPEDPSDNPEQRANRIRSFYKEYFDENKSGQEEYFEDFGPEFYGDGVVYDPATGEYITGPSRPFAQPVGRRAMTPPPRAPPRFQGAARHMPTNSAGGFIPPGPRAFSSASGRLPGPRGPLKPMPPPSPLHVLPTPHLLKDDSLILPIDYAPGKSVKDQREGRPDTALGGLRPYSPMFTAHSPLVSSFDDLAAMPSPHALRKSGTFTALDFAPPPRFKNNDTASDAGSIRSNRTGISTTHMHNIRTGAYRVSRLPADTVGTKDDIFSSLHPKWDMRT